MANTYITLTNLQRYDSNLKSYIDSNKTKALKSLAVVDNKINFYKDAEPAEGAVADFSVDLPVEFFLDQNKTIFVQDFAWNETIYDVLSICYYNLNQKKEVLKYFFNYLN